MAGKTKSKKLEVQTGAESIVIGRDATGSYIHIGDQILYSQDGNLDDLVPPVFNDDRPIPSSLGFYLKVPLAKLGFVFRSGQGLMRVPVVFLAAMLIYAGGIFVFRTVQHTPLPTSLSALFLQIAPGAYFYYPDWNAVAFDFILNPLAVVLSIFYHRTIFAQLTDLFKAGVLQVGNRWNRWLASRVWVWFVFTIPLALGILAIWLSWISRYRYYVNDMLIFREYVLLLIGISTFLRSSMLFSLFHSVLLLSVSSSKIPLDILNPASKRKYEQLGDSCLLIFFSGLLIILYAVTTIYTSIMKDVPIMDDFLFWEAVIHLVIVFLILAYFIYHQILLAGSVQSMKDDYLENKLKAETNASRHQAVSALIKMIPNHPVLTSIRERWLTLMSILLIGLLPISLFAVGRDVH